MAIKVGISGFGRIARVVIRAAMDMPEIEIAGINVRNADLEYLVYMLKYDTTFGRFPKDLGLYDGGLIIDGKKFLSTATLRPLISLGKNVEQNT